MNLIVIADDITGAAEIAGIAFVQGQQVRLLCGSFGGGGSVCSFDTATKGMTVMATDTRSMSEAEAVAETQRVSFLISHSPFLIFKKTDSALRGHVVAELTALMEATGYQRAVYMPANPSQGRIIRNGVYYINGKPIHETAFSYDPEFPAQTSVLRERFLNAETQGIIMPDAESTDDIRRIIAEYNDGQTLFAGAADLFSVLLKMTHGDTPTHSHQTSAISHPTSAILHQPSTLILCGSTQSKPLDWGIPIAPMPREVYDGSEDISLWDTSHYSDTNSLILTMPYTHRTGKAAAVHLRTMMALKAKELMILHCPNHLIIEGGATAWATLQALGWSHFQIVSQIAPGVVQMRAENGTYITLKPGSYPWGRYFHA